MNNRVPQQNSFITYIYMYVMRVCGATGNALRAFPVTKIAQIVFVFLVFFMCSTSHVEAAARQIKTVEYSLGNSGTTTVTAGTAVYTKDVGIGNQTAWQTVAPTVGSEGFIVKLDASNIDIKDAWIEFRAETTALAGGSLVNPPKLALSTCPGSVASCGSAPVYEDLPTPSNPATVFWMVNSGEHNVIYQKADASAAFSGIADGQWATGVETILRAVSTTSSLTGHTATLHITYESDYSTTAHYETKTVRFPLNSTTTNIEGSASTSIAVGVSHSFSYYAQIPDLSSDADIMDVYFELSGQGSHTATSTFTAKIGTTTGASTSPAFIVVPGGAQDTIDTFATYRPPVDAANFQPNVVQYLYMTPAVAALFMGGGELVVTYRYQTDAPVQTETVKYMVGQSQASGGTASSTYIINPVISNTGLSVKNVYVRAQGINYAAAAGGLTIGGDIDDTGGGIYRQNTYIPTFSSEQVGQMRLIYDMSQDAGSFVSGGPLRVESKWQTGSAGSPVALELFVTYTWSGDQGGTQTKSVEYFMQGSMNGSTVGTNMPPQSTFPIELSFPERYTKTLRSAYIETAITSSDAVIVSFNSAINQDAITAGGTGFLSYTSSGEDMSFFTLEGATTSVSVASSSQQLNFNIIGDAINAFSPKMVVTYDVEFTGTPPPTTDRQIRTVEYSLGNSGTTTVTAGTAVYTKAVGIGNQTAWNTVAPSTGAEGFLIKLDASNIDIKDAWIEFRAETTAAGSLVNPPKLALSTCPGSVASCGSAPAYFDLRTPSNPTTVFWMINSGEHNVMYQKVDASAAFSGIADGQWATGVDAILRAVSTTTSLTGHTATLHITYESDYSTTAHYETKTVRFPLNSTTTDIEGSASSSIGVGGSQGFAYYAQIPDLAADADIMDVYFELSGQGSHTAVSTFTAKIGTSTGATSPAFIVVPGGAQDTIDTFATYRPPVDPANFQPNTIQNLYLTPATAALFVAGGELVVTYRYSTDEPVQTETVKYMVGQSQASGGTASSTYIISPVISNTGLSVKNVYVRAQALNYAAAAGGLTIGGDIDDTGGGIYRQNTYIPTFSSTEQVGQMRLIYDMSQDASSFVSGGPLKVESKWQTGSAGSPVALELFVTYTWSGDQGGTQTKSVEYFMQGSMNGSTVGTNMPPQSTFPIELSFPERYTKTLRSAYVETAITSSDAVTSVSFNSAINQDAITAGGTGFVSYTNTAEGMSFITLEGATTSVSVASSSQQLNFNIIGDAINAFSPKMVVTYDVMYDRNPKIISGILYEDEGFTPVTLAKTINIAIGTSTYSLHATTSNTSGTWNFSVPAGDLIVASTPILIYVDGDATTRASLFTKALDATSNIAGLNLYQNRVIISHEGTSGTTTRISDMSFYDGDDDPDIQYTANGGALIVNTNNELHINSGKTFEPGGAVTVNGNGSSTSATDGTLHLATSSIFYASSTLTLAGSFLASSTATYIASSTIATSSGTVFTATTTGKSILVPFTTLGSTTFNGTNGGWTLATTSTTSNLTILNGTLTAPTTTLTITGNYMNNGTFTHNAGTVIFATSTATSTYTGFSFDTSGGSGDLYDITAYNGFFWVTSVSDAEVYKYTATGTYTGAHFDTAGSGNSTPYGITAYNGYFWVTDLTDAEVYKYNLDGTYTGAHFDTAGSGNDSPRGIIAYDGYFWVIDNTDAEVYKYNFDGTYANFSFDTAGSGNGNPFGIIAYNSYFWLTDFVDAEVYKYNFDGTYANFSFDTAGSGNAVPRGITAYNGYLWFADFNDDEVYQYTAGQGISGVATGTSAFNNVTFRGPVAKDFGTSQASTSNFTIEASSGVVTAPWNNLTIGTSDQYGDFTNATTSGFNHNNGTTTFLTAATPATISGAATGTSAFNNVSFSGGAMFASNASTSNFTIDSGRTVIAPTLLSIGGNYTNNGTFTAGSGTTTILTATNTTLTGNMTGTNAWNNLVLQGYNLGTTGYKATTTFASNASTSNLTISASSTLTAPSHLTIKGYYTNNGTFTGGTGTTTFSSSSAQVISGVSTGTSAFNHIAFTGAGTKTFASNASTSNFNIDSTSGAVTLPTLLSVSGNFANSSTTGGFTAGTGTTTLNGTSAQTLSGTMIGASPFSHVAFLGAGTKTFSSNASTSNFIIDSASGAVTAPSLLTISGHYTNNGTFTANSGTTTFSSSTAQVISGVSTGTSAFNNVAFTGAGTKTFSSNASTSNFIIDTTSGSVTLPTLLTVSGHFTNSSTTGGFTANTGSTVFFSSSTAQTISGTLSGTSPFASTTFLGAGTKTFANNASTSSFTIDSTSGNVTLPSLLTISGNFTNSSTTGGFTAGTGTTTLNGTSAQTLSGTMVGSSAWNNLQIANTSGFGSSSQSIIFASIASTTDTLTMLASTSAQFLASATSTFQNINLQGSALSPVWLRSTTPNTQYNFYVPGTQKNVTYVDVRDSNACPVMILAGLTSLNSGNNTCWVFTGALTLSGTLYADEGFTTITSGKTIGIAVGTSTLSLSTATSDGSGLWSFALPAGHSVGTSTPILMWVDGDATTRASLFTKASTTLDITGLDLYQNRVIISHEGTSGTTTRTSQLAFYDGDNDPDIQFTANAGVLVVKTNNELHINTGKTFASPSYVTINGNASSTSATDGTFHLPGTAVYTAGELTTIAGSFLASSTATFISDANGTLFTATTTGKSVLAPFTTLGSTTFNGAGGAWIFATTSTTTNLTILNGTVTAPSTTLAITRNYLNNGTFTHNAGTIIFATSTATSTYTGFHFDTAVSGNGKPTGITLYDGYFWVADDIGDEVYKYNLDGTYIGTSFDTNGSGNDAPYGIAAYNGYFWIVDNTDDEVYKYNLDGTYTGLHFDTAVSGNTNPIGITAYSGYFWIVDGLANAEVYKYNLDGTYTGTHFDTAASGNGDPFGITAYNGYFWVSDTTDDAVYQYTVSGTYTGTSFDTSVSGNGNPYGITAHNGYFWVTDRAGAEIYQYTAGQSISGVATGTSAFNNVIMRGPVAKDLGMSSASTSNLTIESSSGVVTAPYNTLTIGGSFSNATTSGFNHNNGTTTFSSSSAQTISGAATGTSAFSNVRLTGGSTKTFSSNASTSILTIDSGNTLVAPTLLSIGGNYTNNGTFTAGSGTTTILNSGTSTLTGNMTGTSAWNNLVLQGYNLGATTTNYKATTTFASNASTSNLTISASSSLTAPTLLTITGNYVNNGTFINNSGTTYLSSASVQTLAGTMTGTSAFASTTFLGAGTKTFSSNASTSNFNIDSTSGAVTLPTLLTVSGHFTNSSTTGGFTAGSGTTTLNGTSAQTLSGTMIGSSPFSHVAFLGAGTKTFSANASTSSFTIDSTSGNVILPSLLTISGHFTNSSTTGGFTAGTGTTTLTGTSQQTLSGYMTGTSAWNNLRIANTSGFGSSSQSIIFSSIASTTDTLTMLASTSAQFLASATSTFQNINLQGSALSPVWLRSTTPNTQYSFYVPGIQRSVTYVDVRDSNACPTIILAYSNYGNLDSGNNTCWTLGTEPIPLTFSGTLYEDEGFTLITSGKTINIAVGTSTPSVHATTTNASGIWSSTLYDPIGYGTSTPILMWVDGDATTRASLFTKASTTLDITGLDLYQNRVIISHEGTSGTTTRTTDMSFYDGDDDSDIQFTANGGALVVNTNNELHIHSGKTFEPGGAVTINGNASSTSATDGSFHVPALATYTAGGITTIGGNFSASSTATYTPHASGTVFTATSTGRSILAPLTTLGSTTFNGAGGSWTLATTSTTSNLTILNGTVTAPTTTLTITGNYTNNGTFTHNAGTVTFATSTATSTYTGFSFDTAASGNSLPYGITAYNGYFWVTDAADAEVYKYNVDGTYTGTSFDTAASGNGQPMSITTYNGYFWVTDDTDAEVYQYTASGTYTGTHFDTAVSGNDDPSGITAYNGYFWVVDPSDDEVYKYNLDGTYTGTSFDTGANGNFSPYGITAYNGYLWVVDVSIDEVYKYTADGTYTGTSFDTLVSGSNWSFGITAYNGYFWITADTDMEVYKYTAGQSISGVATGTSAFNNVIMRGPVAKDFGMSSASTSNLTIETSSGVVTAPYNTLTIGGSFTNATTSGFNHNNGTTTFSSSSAQTISGASTGTSAFNNISFLDAGTKTFSSNASTSAFTIDSSSGNVTFPTLLSIGGNFTNSSTTGGFTAGSGTTTILTATNTTLMGTMTGTSAWNNLVLQGYNLGTTGYKATTTFTSNASTSNLTISASSSLTAPTLLTITGSYLNNGTFSHNSGTTYFSSASAQTLAGTMTDTSAFATTTFLGAGTKTFSNNASTSNFTIDSTSGAVTAPTLLSISGNYSNNSTFTAGTGTTTLNGTSAQTLTGTMIGTSPFSHVAFTGAGTKTFSANASTSSFTIDSTSGNVTFPTLLTISGNFTNSSTTGGFTAGTGTTTLNGTSAQTLSGYMIGTSAWNNLQIANTSGFGSSSQSIIFANVASTTDTLTMLASTSAQFLASATSTFQNISLQGSALSPVWLRSTTPNTQYSFYVPGIQRSVTYVDVRDSSACPVMILAGLTSLNSGNNTCWVFTGALTLSGTLFSDEGFTTITSGKTIGIAVGTSTLSLSTATSDGSGLWSFALPAGQSVGTSTPILMWVDGDATTRAALFTKASTTLDITGLNLYQNRVIISHEGTSGTTTRTSDMSFYDGDDDSDIQYTANAGALVVNTNNELHINSGKTFEPGGAVTINGNASSTSATDGTLHLPGTAIYYATSTLTLGGSFLASSTATYIASSTIATSSGTVFTATTTGKSVLAPFTTLGSTTFNGTSGGWTLATTSTTSNLTILNGTVTAPTTTLIIRGDYMNLGTFTHNAGTVAFSTTTYGWDLSNASGVQTAQKSVTAQENAPNGVAFSPDGTRMYVVGATNATVYQYSLTTAWDVSTAVYASLSKSVAAQDATPHGVTFSPDGTRMYVMGVASDTVYRYFLTTAWNVSTAVYTSPSNSVNGLDNIPADLTFSPDGTKMYIVGTNSDTVYQYALSTAWNVSTAVYASLSASVTAQETSPTGVTFSPDGTKMYIVGTNSDTVYQYRLGGVSVLGIATGTSAFNTVEARNGGFGFLTNASTTNLTISATASATAPFLLTISGNYTNNGTFIGGSGTTTFSSSSAQTISGTLTGTSPFNHIAFTGAGTKTFSANASTSAFTIDSSSGAVIAPTLLSIGGNYTNNGTFTAGSGTTTILNSGTSTLSGNMTGTSAWNNLVLQGYNLGTSTGLKATTTFASNASTSNLTISASSTLIAPSLLSITGHYTNNGLFTAGSGTTTLNGTSAQTLSGTMVGTSAFNNLQIANTSGFGSSSQSIIFASIASTTDTLTMLASTSAQFLASATSTFTNISLQGSALSPVWLRSTTPNTQYNFYVPGIQRSVTYVDVRDSNACPTTILAYTISGNINSGNNTCWTFTSSIATLSSVENQIFAYGQSATPMSTLTITDAGTPAVTIANGIRILIATTSVNMLWDTTDTSATFGGTASGKVSGPVSYLGNGAMLYIPVTSDWSAGDTLTISDLAFTNFSAVNVASVALGLRTSGAGTSTESSDDKTVAITGALTLSEHTSGQVDDNFDFPTASDVELFALHVTPGGEDTSISALVFNLSGIDGVETADLTNMELYRDMNGDRLFDANDVQIGGAGVVAISGQSGTVTFSTTFTSTTSQDYILVGDTTDISNGDSLVVSLTTTNITTTGVTTALIITETGTVARAQHRKGSQSAGSGEIGDSAPSGDGIQGGGGSDGGGGEIDSDSGDTIGNELGFEAPGDTGAPQGEWTTGSNAYTSDGAYATAGSNGLRQSYGTFGFSVPGSNAIVGIEIKLEASASTNAGTISARLSWDGGGSVTSLDTTGTLTTLDAVYELGGPSDTWGHTWTPAELDNGNFTIELIGNTDSNTVRVDAIQVKVYHQATGGGGGGGGGEVRIPSNRYLANVYTAFSSMKDGVRTIFKFFN